MQDDEVELQCAECTWVVEGRLAGGGERQRFEGQARELGAALLEANRHKWRALRLLITPIADPRPIMIKSEGLPAGSLATDAQSLVHRLQQQQEQEQEEKGQEQQQQEQEQEQQQQQEHELEQEQERRRLAAAHTIQRASRARHVMRRGDAG